MPFLQKKCGLLNLGAWKPVGGGVRWQWDNTYTTTIHAVNSVGALCALRFCTPSLVPPSPTPARPFCPLGRRRPPPICLIGRALLPPLLRDSRQDVTPLQDQAPLPRLDGRDLAQELLRGRRHGRQGRRRVRLLVDDHRPRAGRALRAGQGLHDPRAGNGHGRPRRRHRCARLPPLPSRPTRFLCPHARASPRITLRLALAPPSSPPFLPQTGSRSTPTRRRRCCRR